MFHVSSTGRPAAPGGHAALASGAGLAARSHRRARPTLRLALPRRAPLLAPRRLPLCAPRASAFTFASSLPTTLLMSRPADQ